MINRKIIFCSILVLAVFVGTLYFLPQFFIKKEVGRQGFVFVSSQFLTLDDGGDAYFQFAREVYDGNFPPGDIFQNSPEGQSNIYPWLPPLLLASLIWVFKDVSVAYLAANFVFPVILFLLFYLLGYLVFERNRLLAVFFGYKHRPRM